MQGQILGLYLTRWQGRFKGIEATWLRLANPDGSLLLTAEELERQRAEQAEAQVQQIVRNLLQTGMAVDQVATVALYLFTFPESQCFARGLFPRIG